MTGVERLVDHLIALGYLQYTPPSDVQAARRELVESLSNAGLDTEWDERCVARDRRSYPADNEDLAEGGLGEVILLMKGVLEAEGVRLASVEDEAQGERYDLLLDGRRFCVYDGAATMDGVELWVTATRRLLEIVSELLQAAGSEERLYGINGGNDGRCILLTEKMYALLRSPALQLDASAMPYPPSAMRADGTIEGM
jgi:hypothetical protein